MSKFIGTKIPNSGFVEKIYCNTRESCERVNYFLSKLTFVANPFFSTPIYPILANAEGKPVIFAMKDGNYYEITLVTDLATYSYEHIYVYDPDAIENSGWKKDTVEINVDVVNNLFDLSIGVENELLSGILSISEFTTPRLKDVIRDIANSIREKDGSSSLIKTIEMSDQILQIPSKTSLKYMKDVSGIKFNKELDKETIYSRLASLTYSPDSSLTNNFNGFSTSSYLIAWGASRNDMSDNYVWFKAFKISKDIAGTDRDVYGLTMSIVSPDFVAGVDLVIPLYASDSVVEGGCWEGWDTFFMNSFIKFVTFYGGTYVGLENDKLVDLFSFTNGVEEEVLITLPKKLSGNSLVISKPYARVNIKEMIDKGNLPVEVITSIPSPYIKYKKITSISMDTASIISEEFLSGLNYKQDMFVIFGTTDRVLFVQRINVNNAWVYVLMYMHFSDGGTVLYASADVPDMGATAGWNSSIGDRLEWESVDGEYIIFENGQASAFDAYITYGTIAENIVLDKVYTGVDATITSNQTINVKDWFDNGIVPVHINISSNDMLQTLINSTKSCNHLFMAYNGANVDFIENLDTSSVTNMYQMFYNCPNLTTIPLLDTSSVIDMSAMFKSCYKLNSIPQLNTSNVIYMDRMFYDCRQLISIPQLDTSNVISMNNIFYDCWNLTTIPLLDTSKVTSMNQMFYHCSSLTAIPQLNTSNVTNMHEMFENCDITTIPLLDTNKVTDMGSMFYRCDKLTTIPLLDTSNVTNMSSMFYQCDKLTTIPLLNTSKVIYMDRMFYQCSKLITIPQLNTSKVTSMDSMFYQCYELQKIDITCYNLSDISQSNETFRACCSLKQLIIREFTNYVLNSNAFTYCHHLTGSVHATYNPKGAKDCYIYVPREMYSTIVSATNWSTYASQIRALEDYTVDGTTTGDLDETKI